MFFPFVKTIFIDDAYLGIVARKLNIRPINTRRFRSGNLKIHRSWGQFIAFHGYGNPDNVFQLWKLVQHKH